MADAPLQQIFDEMRTRLQAELDGQIQAARAREAETAARARQEAEADAEKRWAAKLDSVKAEWAARLESEVSAARAEAEKRLVGESMRLRNEGEQAVADARQRAAEELEAERRRADEQLRDLRADLDSERKQLEERTTTTPAELEAAPLLASMRAIDGARSLTDALSALARGATALASRAAVFVVSGTRLEEWPVDGVPALTREPIALDRGGLLHAAVVSGTRAMSSTDDPGRIVPFTVPAGTGPAMAVPLLVGGRAVAVVYAEDGSADRTVASSPAESLELLARHAAACLAHITAVRTLQVGRADGRAPTPEDEQGARRYAKLLVSEIKLYNEGAVRVGREKRDLLHRLRAEIERAQRLYEERVPPSVSGRGSLFQQELVNTLAGGDAALLGS